MSWPIRETESGLFGVMLRPCTLAVTALFLPKSGATVWLRQHFPNPYIEWWTSRIPLTRDTELPSAAVRNLVLDLQLPVSEFRENLPALERHGADLYLMERPVPDTLTLERVPERHHGKILKNNGLIAYFQLPHANEFAWLGVASPRTLERWLEETDLSEWLRDDAA